MATYTIKKGDTLPEIAVKYNTTVSKLVSLNNITDPDYIVVGQVLKLDSSGGSGTSVSKNYAANSRATIKYFGLQSNTDRTIYATWTWDKAHTENYKVMWKYDTGNGVWFIGNDGTSEYKQSTYTAPENAKRVCFNVKPISTKYKKKEKEYSYWTADWSSSKIYSFSSNPPTTPGVPTVSINDYKLTASLDNLNVNAKYIQFQIIKDDATVFATIISKIITNHASCTKTVSAGGRYKVRARSCDCVKMRDYVTPNMALISSTSLVVVESSSWSDYSNSVSSVPAAPFGITTIKAKSETSVYLEWSASNTATSYDIEFATKKEYLDGSNATETITGIEYTHYEKTGLESGQEYFFRVRAVNSQGQSPWSDIKSIALGKEPSAPTTWSSTTTVIKGEPLTLYWVHNSEDNSSQSFAEVEITIEGSSETTTYTITDPEDEEEKTMSYDVDTSIYSVGATLKWRVRTAGVTKVLGEWSVLRTVKVYAPATLSIEVKDSEGSVVDTLFSFPFRIMGSAGPETQKPIGYHLSIIANEAYETTDQIGNFKMVNTGDAVYSKYFDSSAALDVTLSAGDIDLENNITYTVSCKVSMDSGLTAEADRLFTVAWTDEVYEPNAEISIDSEVLSAYIRPYCEDEEGNLIENVLLSVYRREYDGSFTEIASGIDNLSNTAVTDPHPSLDLARYRIVAISSLTGSVSYFDMPGVLVGESSVVLQWNEIWSSFDMSYDDLFEEQAWSGSMLKLPYNVDVSDNHSPDVSLVEYIGRANPVSYYGTQMGATATWNVEIEKSDVETLYALRRLAKWLGDVYVREPSGSGYWANVVVSFSQKHCELTIPVSLNITRVEGGV